MRLRRRLAWLAACCCAACGAAGPGQLVGADDWPVRRLAEFELVARPGTAVGGMLGRAAAIAALLRYLYPGLTAGEERTLLVALPDELFDRLRPAAGGPGFSVRAGDRQVIVVRAGAPGVEVVIAHETVQALLHANAISMPLALEEGLAEYYAWVRFEGGWAVAGETSPARRARLRNGGGAAWLSSGFRTPGESPAASQAWYDFALRRAQWLLLSSDPEAVHRRAIALAPLQSRRAPRQVESGALLPWPELGRIPLEPATRWRLGYDPAAAEREIQTLPQRERGLKSLLAEVAVRCGHLGVARELLAEAAAAGTADADWMAVEGRLELAEGRTESARERMHAALAAGSGSPLLLRELASLESQSEHPEMALALLTRYLATGAEDPEAARYYVTLRQWQAQRDASLTLRAERRERGEVELRRIADLDLGTVDAPDVSLGQRRPERVRSAGND